jgi:hypothetical protein
MIFTYPAVPVCDGQYNYTPLGIILQDLTSQKNVEMTGFLPPVIYRFFIKSPIGMK